MTSATAVPFDCLRGTAVAMAACHAAGLVDPQALTDWLKNAGLTPDDNAWTRLVNATTTRDQFALGEITPDKVYGGKSPTKAALIAEQHIEEAAAALFRWSDR